MDDENQPKQESEEMTNLSEEIRENMSITKDKMHENLLVNNFVAFFEPLIQSLDSNVLSLR